MFEPTEEQQMLQDAAFEAAKAILGGTAAQDDADQRFDKDYFHALGEAGLCGVPVAEDLGGLGLGYLEYAMVLEQIARISTAYAVTVAVNGLPQVILAQYGTDAQRAAWVPALAAGEKLGAFALSETGSGSDAASLKTTARLDGDEYVLNGSKFWITSCGVADLYIVMARTGGPGARGISAFLVPAGTPGVQPGKHEDKMGMRASPTAELVLDQVRIPKDHIIGQEGEGFRVAMSALDSGRITIGATSIGLARAAMEYSAAYACQREQFKRPIIDFQGVGFLLADMAVRIESSRLLVHKAAWLRDHKRPYSPIAAMAKCAATDTAMAVTTDAVQVMGGNGYIREYPVERYMRDAKVMQIVEGTNQVQRLVIARHLKSTFGQG